MNEQEVLTLDRILAQRTQANKEIVNVDEPTIKLVVFELNGDWFAFPGSNIREILSHAEVFFVPGCPSSLEGVINVRGDIESVIRLHELLELPPPADNRAFFVLLGQGSSMRSGIRVDRVVDVIDVAQSNVREAPGALHDQLRSIVSGIVNFQDRPVMVLDLDRIFTGYCNGLG